MAGVRTLADGNTKITMLTTVPADIKTGLTVAALTAGVDVSCTLAKSGTSFAATASESVSEPRICDDTNSAAYGASNYSAQVTVFWMLDPTSGEYKAVDNATYEALRVKGTQVAFAIRDGKPSATAWTAGDVYDIFVVVTDNPQRPSEGTGYIKRTIPLAVQAAGLHRTVVAA